MTSPTPPTIAGRSYIHRLFAAILAEFSGILNDTQREYIVNELLSALAAREQADTAIKVTEHPLSDRAQKEIARGLEHGEKAVEQSGTPSTRYEAHRNRCEREATRDVIFLLQARRLLWTGRMPSDVVWDGDNCCFWKVGANRETDYSITLMQLFVRDSDYALETWLTQSVWLDRDEAEAFGEKTHYRYTEGWRVYGVPSEGELAKMLRGELLQEQAGSQQPCPAVHDLKTIRFTYGDISGVHSCSEPNNQSGDYVPADVARELLRACGDLRQSLSAICQHYPQRQMMLPHIRRAMELLDADDRTQAAIKATKGADK